MTTPRTVGLTPMWRVFPALPMLTFSCSGAMDVDLFQKVIAGAVIDSKREAWMIARLGAGADHPLMMTCPEGEYLKGLQLALR